MEKKLTISPLSNALAGFEFVADLPTALRHDLRKRKKKHKINLKQDSYDVCLKKKNQRKIYHILTLIQRFKLSIY